MSKSWRFGCPVALHAVRFPSIPLQDDSVQSAVAPGCPQASIPLLVACTANVKTVVANPIVYLTNLTHDILQTINALDSPPHPDVVNNEVRKKKKQQKPAGSYLHLSAGCRHFVFLHKAVKWSKDDRDAGEGSTAKGVLAALLYETFYTA